MTCAPISASAWMFERATRECSTSPTIATCSPSTGPTCCCDRVQVEQRLRRVLVLAVAGVDHVRARDPGDEIRRADLRVADDDHVRVVGGERQRRVLQRLALVHRRPGRLDRHHVGGEALRRELEARRGACRRLEEEVDDRAPAQGRQLLHLTVEDCSKLRAVAEQPLDVFPGQVGDRDQVAPRWRRSRGQQLVTDKLHCHWPSSGMSRTRSTSSTSTSWTWMRSPREVGRFLPT